MCELCDDKSKIFIEKARKVHGDKYDYSKVEYVNAKTKVCIICPEHGEFWQEASSHLVGRGCPTCYGKLTCNTEEFIEKARKVHGDKYDYSKVEYVNNRTKVCIICPEHGEFFKSPNNHLKGQGCPKCTIESNKNKKNYTTDEYIFKASQKHHDKYDYSKTIYLGYDKKICIICHEKDENGVEHGEFWQTPNSHLYGRGCPKCGIESASVNRMPSEKEYLNKFHNVHGDKYDYSKVKYKGCKNKICIICPEHGEFWQTPDEHVSGNGCPKCSHPVSQPEKEIYELLFENNIIAKVSDRKLLSGKEIDILCENKSIGFEFDGLYWHSEECGKGKNYHLNKTNESAKNGISLYHIFEDEWIYHKEIVLEKIKHIFHINANKIKVGARQTNIKEINIKTAKSFLNAYHLQGFSKSTLYYGAFANDSTLIGVMSFKKENKQSDKWELTRFATDYHYIIPGLGSKIFKTFIKEYNPSEVKSFADRRWTLNESNNLYTKMGFTLDKILPPDYRYVVNRKRVHKFNFRKQTLHKKYGFPLTMTEKQMCHELRLYRIWDCGLYKYIWKQ